MAQSDSSVDGNLSNDEMNESDIDSDNGIDDQDDDAITEKMDPADREIYERLKQQEREERQEIERELKAHKEALARHQEYEELRAKDLRMHVDRLHREAQHREQQLSTSDRDREREKDRDRAERDALHIKHISSSSIGSVGSNGNNNNNNNGSSANMNSRPSSPHHHHHHHHHSSHNGDGMRSPIRSNGGSTTPNQLLAHHHPHLHNLPHLPGTTSPERHLVGPPPSALSLGALGLAHPAAASLVRDPKLAEAIAASVYGHAAYLDRAYRPKSTGPPSVSSMSPPPLPIPSPGPPGSQDNPSHHWSFQEQFKQLYEINDDPKRREFLDDLFSFMQKRGTPVNRIPIMAKQTLDLYELFRLVVSKGGLVEVINKKLWREITKGLNLPSSITSAAFTLRTQYMKYLYPYECEKLKLSNPSELQSAIDGNRREGRRSSFGYDMSPGPGPTLIPPAHQHHHHHHHPLNGVMLNGKLGSGPSDDDSLPPTPTPIRALTERDALAMEAASRAMEEATRKMEAVSRASVEESPPRKRLAFMDDDRLMPHVGIPSAHLKITSRNDGRSEIDNSLVVSMEINGIMYQGVLFAQHPRRL